MENIVFVISDITSGGGMQRVTINIANYLVNLNKYKVQIISLTPGDKEIKYFVDDRVNIEYLPIENFSLRKHWVRASREIKKIITRDFKGTIIVDDVGYTIPVYAALHSNKNIKFICWTHMHYYHGKIFGFAWTGRRLAVSKFNKVIVLTKEDYEYYKKIDKKGNIVQIYNPIDSNIEINEYKKSSKKIISCGRLNKIKGFDYLIETAKIVFEKHSDWTWDIYGDGEEFDNLSKTIKEYGLEKNIFLKGYKKNILSLYKNYSMYVFTSREEGCPMAMIEAQASGLPMISFNFKCGPSDLIEEGVNGYIINDYNVKEMANKINYLIENPKERCDFSKNSKIRLKELETDFVINKWNTLLDNL